ncbi:exo-alpha-sialidase [Roseovarius albus]|uniref:exo-alpha-sialidase n=1 Tax=Roseovarius albus TaxID=1247867 RepID=UPI00117A5C25|nr:exo-alpha-sialidase [Roseovarius albus]
MHLTLSALVVLSLVLSGWAIWRDQPPVWRFAMPATVAIEGAPLFEQVLNYAAAEGQAHSPGIVLSEDGFSVLWFEGSEEAQADVDIHGVKVRKVDGAWQASAPEPVVTRQNLAAAFEPGQIVITLGNVIENESVRDALYVTAVSVGGWAMASVADVRMQDGVPTKARKLNLSPVINRSFLVKSPTVEMADGSQALPAYFEMGPTYGAFIRTAADGRVRDQRRMAGQGTKPIQPMVVPLSETIAVAFLRDFDRSNVVLISRTEDGGQSWSVAEKTKIFNPSAPVAAMPVGDGQILAVMNSDAERGNRLQMMLSDDEARTWRVIHEVESGKGAARYPMLRRLPDGEIALAFSHYDKRGVQLYIFNESWVMAQ